MGSFRSFQYSSGFVPQNSGEALWPGPPACAGRLVRLLPIATGSRGFVPQLSNFTTIIDNRTSKPPKYIRVIEYNEQIQ